MGEKTITEDSLTLDSHESDIHRQLGLSDISTWTYFRTDMHLRFPFSLLTSVDFNGPLLVQCICEPIFGATVPDSLLKALSEFWGLIAFMNFETWYFSLGSNPKALWFLKGSDGRFFYLCLESSNKVNWNITIWPVNWGEQKTFFQVPCALP